MGLTLRACQIAKSAAADATEAVGTNLPDLYAAVEDCEKELDRLDRDLDQRICAALENTSPLQRREMLACLKCMTDLERIGDLVRSVTLVNRALRTRLENDDVYELMRMALLFEKMLNDVYEAFSTRDLNRPLTVLRTDAEIDRLRKVLVVRHVDSPGSEPRVESVQVLLMAQALERAGDYAKNLAEEVCHFVSGYTLRHLIQKDHASYEQLLLDCYPASQTVIAFLRRYLQKRNAARVMNTSSRLPQRSSPGSKAAVHIAPSTANMRGHGTSKPALGRMRRNGTSARQTVAYTGIRAADPTKTVHLKPPSTAMSQTTAAKTRIAISGV